MKSLNCMKSGIVLNHYRSHQSTFIRTRSLTRLYSIPITTRVEFKESLLKLNYNDTFIFIGSCFSENMSNQLKIGKFNVISNPHGIMFNPISISNSIHDIVKCRQYTRADMFNDLVTKDVIHSWTHHSLFSRTSTETDVMLSNINNHIEAAHQSLVKSNVLLITLGTAYVHQLVSSGLVVSNCHKRKTYYQYEYIIS